MITREQRKTVTIALIVVDMVLFTYMANNHADLSKAESNIIKMLKIDLKHEDRYRELNKYNYIHRWSN